MLKISVFAFLEALISVFPEETTCNNIRNEKTQSLFFVPHRDNFSISRRQFSKISLASIGVATTLLFSGCGSQQSAQYEATAKSSITWRVPYYEGDSASSNPPRYEEFESVSLTNVNGEKPDGAVFQDDKGIWWPKEPPKPTIDEIEAGKKKPYETIGKPERLRQVEYRVKYNQDGEKINLPTNYSVYRQVVKAYPDTPLNFTMGLNNGSVTKATPINN